MHSIEFFQIIIAQTKHQVYKIQKNTTTQQKHKSDTHIY